MTRWHHSKRQTKFQEILLYFECQNTILTFIIPLQILREAGISCSYTYSSLDQTARKINVAKFRAKKTMVLIVTDLAARGIDIPLLDNVINYNFPAKAKLFVHRVGRCARAGQSGIAYSLVGADEVPYVIDLHLFLGRPLTLAKISSTAGQYDFPQWGLGML